MKTRSSTVLQLSLLLIIASRADAQTRTSTVNDDLWNVVPVELSVDGAVLFTGDNRGATLQGDLLPGSVLDLKWGFACVWQAFIIHSGADVTVNYAGTQFAQPSAFVEYLVRDPGPDERIFEADQIGPAPAGDGNYCMTFLGLKAGTYYLPVGFIAGVAEGEYTIVVSAEPHAPDEVVER